MALLWGPLRATDGPGRLTLVTGPTLEPLTVAEAMLHLNEPPTGDEGMVEQFIVAARHHAEALTGRQFLTATWRFKLDRFPCYDEPVVLPKPPLLTVASVKYRDTADVLQTWAASEYVVDAPAGPAATEGRVYLGLNKTYPVTADRPDAVEIEFTAGYGATAETVPQPIRQAMLLMIGHWYANRETVSIGSAAVEVPFSAEALLAPFVRVAALVR